MKYDSLIENLREEGEETDLPMWTRSLLRSAAEAIKELQSTVLIVEIKDDEDERPN